MASLIQFEIVAFPGISAGSTLSLPLKISLQGWRQSELPFQLEHHKDRVVFLLAKEYETQYHALLAD
jgi:hypothetical protein